MSPRNRSWDCLERGRGGGWGDAINNARGMDHEKNFSSSPPSAAKGSCLVKNFR